MTLSKITFDNIKPIESDDFSNNDMSDLGDLEKYKEFDINKEIDNYMKEEKINYDMNDSLYYDNIKKNYGDDNNYYSITMDFNDSSGSEDKWDIITHEI